MTILEMFQSKDENIQILGSVLLLNETDTKIINSCISYYNDKFLTTNSANFDKIWFNMNKIIKKWKNIK